MGAIYTNCPCCGRPQTCSCCEGSLLSSIFINIPSFTCEICSNAILTPPNSWTQLESIFSAGFSTFCVRHNGCNVEGIKRALYTSPLIYDDTELQNALAGNELYLGLASVAIIVDAQCPGPGYCYAEAVIEISSIGLFGPSLYGIDNSILWNDFLDSQNRRLDQLENQCPSANILPRGRLYLYGMYNIHLGTSRITDPHRGFINGACNNILLHHNNLYNQNNVFRINPYPFSDITLQ